MEMVEKAYNDEEYLKKEAQGFVKKVLQGTDISYAAATRGGSIRKARRARLGCIETWAGHETYIQTPNITFEANFDILLSHIIKPSREQLSLDQTKQRLIYF